MMPISAVPTSVPFTYRDGITTLELIECVRANLDILQADFNTLAASVNGALADNQKEIQDIADNLIVQMQNLRTDLVKLIESSVASGVAWSPVYGHQVSASQALGEVYDNLREHGLFVDDYDNMAFSAGDYDALGLSAREYDIKATMARNLIPGDFKGREEFPWGKSTPEPPTQDNDLYLRKADAADMYVERNPTARNFESKPEVL